MLPPRALGTITHIAEKGSYAVDVCVDVAKYQRMRLIFILGHSSGNRV